MNSTKERIEMYDRNIANLEYAIDCLKKERDALLKDTPIKKKYQSKEDRIRSNEFYNKL